MNTAAAALRDILRIVAEEASATAEVQQRFTARKPARGGSLSLSQLKGSPLEAQTQLSTCCMGRLGGIIPQMHWFENLPWWAKTPLIVGGALMSAFSNSFPQGFQTAGLFVGVVIALFGCLAVTWHFVGTKFTTRFAFQWPIRRKNASSPTLRVGLYVSDIRFTFASLEKDRYSEITMRVFNGTGRIVDFCGLSGHIKFNAPNNADPSRMGDLPTPSVRPDMARMIGPLQEWLLILSQRVPAAEADKLLAMLAADIPIHFDLSGLAIDVCAQDDRQNVERLPIWGGVSYNHGNGFGQIVYLTAHMKL